MWAGGGRLLLIECALRWSAALGAQTPPPPLPGADAVTEEGQKCVEPGRCPLEGANAPVFVRDLGEAGRLLFPAKTCLQCRPGTACRSALVRCPTEPGGALREELWEAGGGCEGPATRTGYVSAEEAYCPGPDTFGVESLDLEFLIAKLQRDHAEHVPDEAVARRVVEEYRRMLALVQKQPEGPVVPSKLVDLAWHEHILDSARYRRDCLRVLGRFLHHSPSFEGEEERIELAKKQREMFRAYAAAFGEAPPLDVWPTAPRAKRLGSGGELPDCCAASCVKPSCQDCVGCNSVDCGYLGAGGNGTQRLAPADALAGAYVPAERAVRMAPPRASYACGFATGVPDDASPYEMRLDWTICGERIHVRHSLVGLSAWFSLGLPAEAADDMGFGDFLLTIVTQNYTGVKDLYKYDAGNLGYPCWDVIHECSVGNKTKGTKDVEGEQVTRADGVTTSTWSRRLRTPDYKDRPIEPGVSPLLLAHGLEDYFTYHNEHSLRCNVDFFSGHVECPAPSARRGSAAAETLV